MVISNVRDIQDGRVQEVSVKIGKQLVKVNTLPQQIQVNSIFSASDFANIKYENAFPKWSYSWSYVA